MKTRRPYHVIMIRFFCQGPGGGADASGAKNDPAKNRSLRIFAVVPVDTNRRFLYNVRESSGAAPRGQTGPPLRCRSRSRRIREREIQSEEKDG